MAQVKVHSGVTEPYVMMQLQGPEGTKSPDRWFFSLLILAVRSSGKMMRRGPLPVSHHETHCPTTLSPKGHRCFWFLLFFWIRASAKAVVGFAVLGSLYYSKIVDYGFGLCARRPGLPDMSHSNCDISGENTAATHFCCMFVARL